MGRMFAFDGVGEHLYFDLEVRSMLILGGIFGLIAAFGNIEKWWLDFLSNDKKTGVLLTMTAVGVLFTVLCIASITSSGFNPFIYFRF
jgi:hypothetical protein